MAERIRRSESHRIRAGDASVFVRQWIPEAPRGSVVLVHGFGEHSGRYEELAAWLAGRCFRVVAYDQRGHGRSGGEPNHVKRFAQLQDDLDLVVADAQEGAAGQPISLLGHSMGGLVAASYLAERSTPIARAVLSAPALGTAGEKPPSTRMARLIRLLRPRHRVPAPFVAETLCTDPAVVEAYLADPWVRHESMTVSLALELLSAMEGLSASDIQVPTLVLHGGEDEVCPPGASEAFARALPRGKWVRYPGLRHEILNEPSRAEIFQEILRWLEAAEEPSA